MQKINFLKLIVNNKTTIDRTNNTIVARVASVLFGVVVLAIGIVNTFWGNDPGFGIFMVLLSFVYFPPVDALIKKITGFAIPVIIKIVLGFFILWASLGVGELFYKIGLMIKQL